MSCFARSAAWRAAVAVLLMSAGALPGAAADIRRDCQSGQPAACTQILQSNPSDFVALSNRGVGLRISGAYDRAIADFDAAIRLNPGVAGIYLERGLAYEAKGEHAIAIMDFDAAIRRDPTLVQAYFGRALAYDGIGEGQRATADLTVAASLDRNLVAALHMQRGYELKAAGRSAEAIAAFGRAIAINPNWPLAYFGRAASFDDQGDREHAAADYRTCIALNATTALERQRQQEARRRLDELSSP